MKIEKGEGMGKKQMQKICYDLLSERGFGEMG